MSFTATAVIAATLLASHAHPGTYDVTAGPAKMPAQPGQTVTQKVSNHGTLPEVVRVAIDEIGHAGGSASGACGFTHAAPLATPSVSNIQLNPGTFYNLSVKVAPTGPAGYHAITVAYTVGGTGAVKVTQGVATVIGVTYPGSASASAPCVAVAQTPTSHGPAIAPLAATAGLAGLTGLGILSALRIRRNRRTA